MNGKKTKYNSGESGGDNNGESIHLEGPNIGTTHQPNIAVFVWLMCSGLKCCGGNVMLEMC